MSALALGRRRVLFLVPALGFLVIALFLAVGLTRDPQVLPSALIDEPAPQFDLPPLEGRDGGEVRGADGLARADLGGEPVLVNIFASWCVPCRIEHPFLTQLAEEGVTVHAINYKDEAEDARDWLDRYGDPFSRIGVDRDGRAGVEWGVYGVPETFIVDGEGTIVHKHVGPVQERDLPTIRRILEELG